MVVVTFDQLGKDGRLDGSCFAVRTDRTRRAVLGLSNFPRRSAVGNDLDSPNLDEAANVSASTGSRAPPPVGSRSSVARSNWAWSVAIYLSAPLTDPLPACRQPARALPPGASTSTTWLWFAAGLEYPTG